MPHGTTKERRFDVKIKPFSFIGNNYRLFFQRNAFRNFIMGIFRKLIVGLKRTFGAKSLDYVSEQKSYGNDAEFAFGSEIGKYIPSC